MSKDEGGAVLVVDDDEINRLLISTLLENQGYGTRTAADGEQALAALGEERFDVVLLDVVMPRVDGIEVLRTMKRDSRLWDIPVIMISSVEETRSVVLCLELGAADFVSKPFDPVILRAKINGCLARKRLHDTELEYQRMVKEQAAQVEELNRQLARRVRDRVAKSERQARLRRFLPSQLVQAGVISDEDEMPLQARRREVCVVTARLCGLSMPADGVNPEWVLAVLHQFHATVNALAATFRAGIASSAGDTSTIVFDDILPWFDAVAAVRFGVTLAGELGPLIEGWSPYFEAALVFGVGIGCGPAVLGGVDVEGRCDYVVLGGVIERAAILAQEGRGVVLVDEGVHAATGDTVELVAADAVPGGFTGPAYRVVGIRDVASVPSASPGAANE